MISVRPKVAQKINAITFLYGVLHGKSVCVRGTYYIARLQAAFSKFLDRMAMIFVKRFLVVPDYNGGWGVEGTLRTYSSTDVVVGRVNKGDFRNPVARFNAPLCDPHSILISHIVAGMRRVCFTHNMPSE